MTLPVKKKTHYGRAILIDSDGQPLTGISDKKAGWYLRKGLAEEVPGPLNGYEKVLKLKNPAASKNTNESRITPVQNRCVVCGKEEDLTLHHVLPYFLRRILPRKLKAHDHEWCVLLCLTHHDQIEVNNLKNLHGSFLAWQGRFLKKVSEIFRFITNWLFVIKMGGLNRIKQKYKTEFLKLEPKYLPKGFLE